MVPASLASLTLDSVLCLASSLEDVVTEGFVESVVRIPSEEDPNRRLDEVDFFVARRGLLSQPVLVEALEALWLEAAMVEPV